MRSSVAVRNANLQQDGERLNGGYLRLYDGVQPIDPDTSLAGNTLIVELLLANPAMGAVSAGTRAFNVIASAIVNASGSPTFGRFYQSDGVTAEHDMKVGSELMLTKAAWTAGEPFPGLNISWTQAVGT